jgi:hypothetical protein
LQSEQLVFSLKVDKGSDVKTLRTELAERLNCAPNAFKLVTNEVTLRDEEALDAALAKSKPGMKGSWPKPYAGDLTYDATATFSN